MKDLADIIVVGAGASGLMAALELSKAGMRVKILEGQSRSGGRIHTITNFSNETVEAGAEFIHGNLPITTKLLKEGNIPYYAVTGKFWQVKKGIFKQEEEFIEGWGEMMMALKSLQTDMTVENFLSEYFSGKRFEGLRKSVTKFVEGYDLADIRKASILSLKDEWMKEEESEDFRIEGGYMALINYLLQECNVHKVSVEFDTVVKEIVREDKQVNIICDNGIIFSSKKVLVTVPLGIIVADADEKAFIKFNPPIHKKLEVAKNMGYGSVIKILLDFKEAFWKQPTATHQNTNLKDLGFILSDEIIPTWWTQYPKDSLLLTGWLGGKKAYELKDEKEILGHALDSLSNIFKVDTVVLQKKLNTYSIYNWTINPFSKGAYSYPTLFNSESKEIMNKSEEDTLFFAGEALNEGKEFGTVEAALSSGINTAKKILNISVSL